MTAGRCLDLVIWIHGWVCRGVYIQHAFSIFSESRLQFSLSRADDAVLSLQFFSQFFSCFLKNYHLDLYILSVNKMVEDGRHFRNEFHDWQGETLLSADGKVCIHKVTGQHGTAFFAVPYRDSQLQTVPWWPNEQYRLRQPSVEMVDTTVPHCNTNKCL